MPQIYVEHSRSVRRRRSQKLPYRFSRLRRTLRQRSEAHRVCFERKLPVFLGPLEKIPGRRLCDLEPRLAGRIYAYLHRARRMVRVLLNIRAFKPECLKLILRLISKFVPANPARHQPAVAQHTGYIREVGWSPAQLFAGGKNVPQQLTQSNHNEMIFLHISAIGLDYCCIERVMNCASSPFIFLSSSMGK